MEQWWDLSGFTAWHCSQNLAAKTKNTALLLGTELIYKGCKIRSKPDPKDWLLKTDSL